MSYIYVFFGVGTEKLRSRFFWGRVGNNISYIYKIGHTHIFVAVNATESYNLVTLRKTYWGSKP